MLIDCQKCHAYILYSLICFCMNVKVKAKVGNAGKASKSRLHLDNRYIPLHPISTIVKATPPKHMNTAWQLLEADSCVTRLLDLALLCASGVHVSPAEDSGHVQREHGQGARLKPFSDMNSGECLHNWRQTFSGVCLSHKQWNGRFSARSQHSNLHRAFRWEMLQQY